MPHRQVEKKTKLIILILIIGKGSFVLHELDLVSRDLHSQDGMIISHCSTSNDEFGFRQEDKLDILVQR